MKRLFIITLSVLLFGSSAIASEYTKFSRKFIKHFKDCDKYEETVNSIFEDENFKTHRKIQGWKNGACRYIETVTSKNSSYKLSCGIPSAQVSDLYEAMKDKSKKAERFNLDLYSPRINKKTGETEYYVSGQTEIKGNKAYILWARIQNNPYMCKVENLSKSENLAK